MNKKSMAILATILLLAAGCGPKTNDPSDIAAIKAMEESYLRAVNAGDAAAVASLYAEDAVLLAPNTPALVGREAIQASYQSDFDLYKNEEVDVIEDVQVVGDIGFVRGTYTNKATPKVPGPAVIKDKGKWAAVSRHQPDGSWKYIFDTWNTDLPVGRVVYPGGEDEQVLLQLERDWAAALMRQDAAALDPILADAFVENRMGVLTKKKDLLAGMKPGRSKPESVEVGDMRVLVFGEFAVVNGRGVVKETLRGKEVVDKVRFVDTFQKQEGTWKAVAAFIVPDR
jgi:uncharacterized protein (TIGR02246 family)